MENDIKEDFGTETPLADIFKINPQINTIETKTKVEAWDIFKLAKLILLICAIIFLILAMIRIFYDDHCEQNSRVKEVWDYSKVILNSTVSLVLGLYFGSSHKEPLKR